MDRKGRLSPVIFTSVGPTWGPMRRDDGLDGHDGEIGGEEAGDGNVRRHPHRQVALAGVGKKSKT